MTQNDFGILSNNPVNTASSRLDNNIACNIQHSELTKDLGFAQMALGHKKLSTS